MLNELIKSGIDIVGDVPWGTHFCQFYETKEDLVDILVPYFKTGLENNEFCMWVTSKPLSVKEATNALRNAVQNIDSYLEKGQIEIIPYSDWYMEDDIFDPKRVLNGWIEKLKQAQAQDYNGMRLTGNTFWLEQEDWTDFIEYEEEVDKVIGNYQMIALCTYCLDKCSSAEIIDVVVNHQFALIKRGKKWELIESVKHKITSDKLKKSQQTYRSLFDNMMDGYAYCEMIYDNENHPMDFIYLNVNDAFERLTGLKNVEDKKVSEVIPGIAEAHPELLEIYGRVASTGQAEKFEIEFKPLGIWLSVAVFSPEKNHFIATFDNFTERKLAEEEVLKAKDEWEHTFDAVPDLIAIVDLDYQISRVNQAMARRLGVNLKNCTGKCFELIHGINEPPSNCPHKCMLEDGKEHTLEIHEDRLNGDFISSASPMYNDKKELIGCVHVLRDITERKRTEEELKKTFEQLQRSNRELEQFAYVSSHDLQEPLRTVASFTQLLERQYKGKFDADSDEYIGFIVEGAKRMKYLIDDLLAFSRVNTRAGEFELADMEMVLDAALLNSQISVDDNGAQITYDIPPSIMCDATQLVQVFHNLIDNAIKFNDKENPEIFISAQKNHNEWKFAVTDNGIGIDPEHQKQIFEIFKRLHTREEYPGTGIGLALCQKIIERHGGNIWVESKLFKGSTFYFTIPDALDDHIKI